MHFRVHAKKLRFTFLIAPSIPSVGIWASPPPPIFLFGTFAPILLKRALRAVDVMTLLNIIIFRPDNYIRGEKVYNGCAIKKKENRYRLDDKQLISSVLLISFNLLFNIVI